MTRKLGKFQQKVFDAIPQEGGVRYIELAHLVTPFVNYGVGIHGYSDWSRTGKALSALIKKGLIIIENWNRADCMIYRKEEEN